MSRLAPRSARSAYLCFFPTPFDHDLRAVAQAARPNAWARTFGARPAHVRRRLVSPGGRPAPALDLDHRRRRPRVPPGRAPPAADGARPSRGARRRPCCDRRRRRASARRVDGRARSFAGSPSRWRLRSAGTELHFVSDTSRPAAPTSASSAWPSAGAWLLSDGPGPARATRAPGFPWLARDPNDLNFLDSYDTILANSEYTRGWIRRLWQRDADVLYPPIATGRFVRPPSGSR